MSDSVAPARIYLNTSAAVMVDEATPDREPLAFHRRLPGYVPTPLLGAPGLAASLGVGRVWVKDESSRLGLPSFKIMGASWAVHRALRERLGATLDGWQDVDELAQRLAPLRPLTLTAATDGNHGRAVAHMAALLGLAAHIYVPAGTAPARITAIEGEGATVSVVDGTYDDAVALAAEQASDHCLVISDTSWPGYETVPRLVIEGYATILWEVEDELKRRGEREPDVVVVQLGVGALAAAVVRHYRRPGLVHPPRLIGVEPLRAACLLASMEAGRIVQIPGPHDSIMAGLNAGTPSLVAWPIVSKGIDLFMAVDDERARGAMRALAAEGITAGETGAAGLAGLTDLLTGPIGEELRGAWGIDDSTRVLLLNTEGATDPAAYARIVGDRTGAR